MAQEVTIEALIKVRRDTTEAWTSSSAILAEGEFGYDLEKHILKIGDGKTAFDQLPAIDGNSEICTQLQQKLETLTQEQQALQEKQGTLEGKQGTLESRQLALKQQQDDLSNSIQDKIDQAIEDKFDQAVTAFTFKGTKDSRDKLPTAENQPDSGDSAPAIGDVWQVGQEGPRQLYVWDGDSWETFGEAGTVDLEGYLKADKLPKQLHAGPVTATEDDDSVTLSINAWDLAEDGRSFSSKVLTVDLPAATALKAGVMTAGDKDKLDKLKVLQSSEAENRVKFEEDGTLSVNRITVDRLANAEGWTLVLDGGDANAGIT